jgi:hypothetical protein
MEVMWFWRQKEGVGGGCPLQCNPTEDNVSRAAVTCSGLTLVAQPQIIRMSLLVAHLGPILSAESPLRRSEWGSMIGPCPTWLRSEAVVLGGC